MKDRILIDGCWYVKENTSKKKDVEPTEFRGLVCETDTSCFELTVLIKEDRTMYGCSIKYTDKRTEPWKDEFWDNETWLLNILKTKTVDIDLTEEDKQVLITLIEKAEELKFL